MSGKKNSKFSAGGVFDAFARYAIKLVDVTLDKSLEEQVLSFSFASFAW